jgi:hypothetical protein
VEPVDNIRLQSNLHVVSVVRRDGVRHVRVAVTGKGFNGEGDMAFTLDGDRSQDRLSAEATA